MNARRTRHRNPLVIAAILALLAVMPAAPATAATLAPDATQDAAASTLLTADLDGRPIELAKVGTLHCHDFDYPRIHCFATQAALEDAVSTTLAGLAAAAATTNYVVVFDGTFYSGPSMFISSDYSVLALVGWNDRISSFKGMNGESGTFYWDWFYGGSQWAFCCNQQATTMGSFNDNVSSVKRS
jgi:hypothetical protein